MTLTDEQRRSIKRRFLAKVDWDNPSTDCWLWQGAKGSDGYGRFRGSKAHRWAYARFVDTIPEGLHVLHDCDVKLCVNPTHLFIGTPADNSRDAVVRGRIPRGEHHYRAKLTESDALRIMADSRSLSVIAREYGVSHSTVDGIKTGKTWRWLTKRERLDHKRIPAIVAGEQHRFAKLTAEQVLAIRSDTRESRVRLPSLAKTFLCV